MNFKRGDIVQYLGEDGAILLKGFHYVVESAVAASLKVEGVWFNKYVFKLIRRPLDEKDKPMEKRFKIQTELSLGEMKTLWNKLAYQQQLSKGLAQLCAELAKIHQENARKTVQVGGKTYYEDELATALASIKEVKNE